MTALEMQLLQGHGWRNLREYQGRVYGLRDGSETELASGLKTDGTFETRNIYKTLPEALRALKNLTTPVPSTSYLGAWM